MRKSLSVVIFTLAAAIAASACLAAAPPPPKKAASQDQQFAELSRKLGLSKKQSDSIKAISKKCEEDMRKAMQSKASEKDKAKQQQAIALQAQTRINAVLTPEQRKKLQEMIHQARPQSPPASASQRRGMSYVDAVQAALKSVGVTKEQKPKIDLIMKDFWKKRSAVKQDKKLTEAQKKAKLRTLKQQTLTRIDGVLTPAQRKRFQGEVHRFGSMPASAGAPAAKPSPTTAKPKPK